MWLLLSVFFFGGWTSVFSSFYPSFVSHRKQCFFQIFKFGSSPLIWFLSFVLVLFFRESVENGLSFFDQNFFFLTFLCNLINAYEAWVYYQQHLYSGTASMLPDQLVLCPLRSVECLFSSSFYAFWQIRGGLPHASCSFLKEVGDFFGINSKAV